MTTCTDDHITPLCSEKFENIENGVSEILKNQQIIHDKMFVDNGAESYQTFRRKAETFIRGITWAVGIFFATVITTVVGILITQALS